MPDITSRAVLAHALAALTLLALTGCSPAPTTGTDGATAASDTAEIGVLEPEATAETSGPRGPTLEAPCAEATTIPDAPPAAARRHTYAAREALRTCITLRSQADGGRRTPVYSGYRPEVRLTRDADAQALLRCAVRLDDDGGAEPGTRVAAALVCDEPVEIGSDAPGFVLVEGGREVGSGTVILPPR